MTFSPLALVLIPAGYLFLWPLISVWLDDSSPLLNGLTAICLSMGLLTLVMMWLGFLPIPFVYWPVFVILVLGGLGIGYWLNPTWFAPREWLAYWLGIWKRYADLSIESLMAWTVFGIMSVILIHVLYYPFLGDDVLARYGLHAQQIYRSNTIPAEVSGYPPLAALTFVWTWFAAGTANEHLAKLFAVITSTGTLAATYLVGKMWLGSKYGWLAVVLVVLVPAYVINSTIAYVDIPTVFPVMLSIVFIWRWWQSNRLKDAIVAGLLIGIAILVKQSALAFAGSMVGVVLLYLITKRGQNAVNALSALACVTIIPLLIAGPWFLRNYLLGETILPIAGLYHINQSSASARDILIPYTLRNEFGSVTSEVLTLGWFVGLGLAVVEGLQALRGRVEQMPMNLVLAGFAFPYWVAWWQYFSFDPRFILLILPILALWAALIVKTVASRVSLPLEVPRLAWQGVLILCLAWFAFQAVETRLGGVYYTVTEPFASDVAKLDRAKGRMYGVVTYVRNNIAPDDNHLMLMDGRMHYYLLDYNVRVHYPSMMRELDGFDYLVHSSGFKPVYEGGGTGLDRGDYYPRIWSERYFEPVFEAGGVHVMRIKFDDFEDRLRIAQEFNEELPER